MNFNSNGLPSCKSTGVKTEVNETRESIGVPGVKGNLVWRKLFLRGRKWEGKSTEVCPYRLGWDT